MKYHHALIKSYARQARYYDHRWAHYNRATLRATLDAVPWVRLRKVLDVGCGTGLVPSDPLVSKRWRALGDDFRTLPTTEMMAVVSQLDRLPLHP